jgi:hypothetical protein
MSVRPRAWFDADAIIQFEVIRLSGGRLECPTCGFSSSKRDGGRGQLAGS